MAEQDCILEMRRRFRRHMGTSLLGLLGAFLIAGIGGGIAGALDLGSAKRFVVGAVVMSAVAIAPVVGIMSARRNLRCPACEGSLWGMASFGTSPVRAASRRHCRHCGALLVGEGTRRVRIVLVLVAAAIGMAGAAASMALQR